MRLHPKSTEAPSGILNAAILLETIFKNLGGQDRLDRAIELLASIPRDYPGDRLADDALVRLGDLQLEEQQSRRLARKSYEEVMKAYQNSDMFEAARLRLLQLESGVTESSEPPTPASKGDASGKILVVIDPGHGGEDFGAAGYGGLLEKDVVLNVALELEKLLQEKLNAVVRMTRRKDVFVPLADRTALANDFDADIFISLHANASPGGKLSGVETYYLDNSGDKASERLAEMENKVVHLEGPEGDLKYMLSDLIQSAKLEDSMRLAKNVQDSIMKDLRIDWNVGKSFGVKKGPFYVLVGAHMPCILVEMGFVDNRIDGSNLADKRFRSELSKALFLGIKNFITPKGKR